jgi:hypothetical protein
LDLFWPQGRGGIASRASPEHEAESWPQGRAASPQDRRLHPRPPIWIDSSAISAGQPGQKRTRESAPDPRDPGVEQLPLGDRPTSLLLTWTSQKKQQPPFWPQPRCTTGPRFCARRLHWCPRPAKVPAARLAPLWRLGTRQGLGARSHPPPTSSAHILQPSTPTDRSPVRPVVACTNTQPTHPSRLHADRAKIRRRTPTSAFSTLRRPIPRAVRHDCLSLIRLLDLPSQPFSLLNLTSFRQLRPKLPKKPWAARFSSVLLSPHRGDETAVRHKMAVLEVSPALAGPRPPVRLLGMPLARPDRCLTLAGLGNSAAPHLSANRQGQVRLLDRSCCRRRFSN